jgi:hypothetical protein
MTRALRNAPAQAGGRKRAIARRCSPSGYGCGSKIENDLRLKQGEEKFACEPDIEPRDISRCRRKPVLNRSRAASRRPSLLAVTA